MDFSPLIGPATVAAGVSGVISVVGLIVSNVAARRLHTEKLGFDSQLAERKFEFDKDLAERKFRYDRELHDHKRQVELAEEVLADFYQAKGIFEWARDIDTPGGEGEAGKAEPGETPEQTRYRNALYAPIQRLTNQNEFFAAIAARRFRFKAVFGPAADKPFTDLAVIQNEIFMAARRLIINYRNAPIKEPPQISKWQAVIGWALTDDDPITSRLEAIIDEAEQLCRPLLRGKA